MKHRTSTSILLVITCLAPLFISSCTSSSPSTSPSPSSVPSPSSASGQPAVLKSGGLTATPIDIFQGPGQKFRPFLGSTAGGVSLAYKGKISTITIVAESWENGKPAEVKNASFGVMLNTNPDNEGLFQCDFTASVKEIRENDSLQFEITTSLLSGSSQSSNTVWIPAGTMFNLTSPLHLTEPILITKETPEAVWGFQATTKEQIEDSYNMAKSAAEAEYAILFKIKID
ncbi:hypothetical protein [Paenibacillus lutrae]|uniref:Lipoprotein n=1 Tax=Paenibacillus lutrae TaxID=2078573 RepID=A0A7X3K1S9_9BACL|nr:hypothetical protein [Paenibacillus lutrae]MVP02316.1 hypothetical protein [Paenibacillus lutrae]